MMDELNKRIAELLGWHDFEEKTWWHEDYDDTRQMRTWFGTTPEGSTERLLPDFRHDLDAVTAVLARHDVTLTLDFGPVLSARIIPESYVGEPEVPEFSANSAEHWQLVGEHADIALLAALAFVDWLTWMREQGGTP